MANRPPRIYAEHPIMPDEARMKVIVDQVRPYHCLKDPDVELPALMLAFAQTRAQRFLEIGTYQGATAAAMKLAFPDAEIWTIDLPDPRKSRFNAQPKDKVGLAYRELGLSERIEQVWMDAAKLATPPPRWPRFDLIFVDGDHSEDACYRDLRNSVGSLNAGGVIVAHDYTDHSDAERPPWTQEVHRAVGRFMADGRAEAGWRRKRLPGWLVKLYCEVEWHE